MVSFKSEFRVVLCEELDARSLGGDSSRAEQIMKSLDDTRKHSSEVLGNNIRVSLDHVSVANISRGNTGGRGVNIHWTRNGLMWHVYGGVFHISSKDWRV